MQLSVDTWLLLTRETVAVFVCMAFSILQITAWWQITSLETTGFDMFSFAVVAASSLDYCCRCSYVLKSLWKRRGSCDMSFHNIKSGLILQRNERMRAAHDGLHEKVAHDLGKSLVHSSIGAAYEALHHALGTL